MLYVHGPDVHLLNMKKKVILTALSVLLVITAVVLFPTSTSIPGSPITIGVISSTNAGLQSNIDLYDQIIGPDINEYLSQLPTIGRSPKMRVEFLIEGPDEGSFSPEEHLEKVQELHAQEVKFFIAGFWSSQYQGSIDYINENDLLMVSPSSTSPQLAMADNGFRLAPPDTDQANVINEMLLTYDEGIGAIVTILRDDVWGTSLVDALADVYGGEIVQIPYPVETVDFTDILFEAEIAATELVSWYGANHVGVLMVAFDENVDILQQAVAYPTIFDLPWFGTENTGRSQAILQEASFEACHVRLVSAIGAAPDSIKYNDFAERWALFGYEAGFYTTTAADAAWLIVETYMDVKASLLVKPISGLDVALVFRDNAANYYGYSGWTFLDENGDRALVDYDIWGFREDPATGEPTIINYGYYDTIRGTIHWTYEPPIWD
jgi:branched-chain amino acid transport system substrate-binding protein